MRHEECRTCRGLGGAWAHGEWVPCPSCGPPWWLMLLVLVAALVTLTAVFAGPPTWAVLVQWGW